MHNSLQEYFSNNNATGRPLYLRTGPRRWNFKKNSNGFRIFYGRPTNFFLLIFLQARTPGNSNFKIKNVSRKYYRSFLENWDQDNDSFTRRCQIVIMKINLLYVNRTNGDCSIWFLGCSCSYSSFTIWSQCNNINTYR